MPPFVLSLPREPRLVTWAHRGLGLFIAAFLLLGAIGSYRAWVQVYRVGVQVRDPVLGPAGTVQVRVVTSGRTFVDVRLELLQSGQAELLARHEIPKNDDAAFDFRSQRYLLALTLQPALWTRFHSGPAILRATATGRPQWLRTPPPTVSEYTVTLR